MPGSPVSKTTCPCPDLACSHRSRRRVTSDSRPTSGVSPLVCATSRRLVVYLYHADNFSSLQNGYNAPISSPWKGATRWYHTSFSTNWCWWVCSGSAACCIMPGPAVTSQTSRGSPSLSHHPASVRGSRSPFWPHPHAPLRGLCAGRCAAPPGALRPTTPHRLHAWSPAPGGHVVAFLPAAPLCLSGLGGAGQSPCEWAS